MGTRLYCTYFVLASATGFNLSSTKAFVVSSSLLTTISSLSASPTPATPLLSNSSRASTSVYSCRHKIQLGSLGDCKNVLRSMHGRTMELYKLELFFFHFSTTVDPHYYYPNTFGHRIIRKHSSAIIAHCVPVTVDPRLYPNLTYPKPRVDYPNP